MLFGGVGDAVVSPEALRALAEGFEAVAGTNVIPSMCAGQDADQERFSVLSCVSRHVSEEKFHNAMAVLPHRLVAAVVQPF